MSLYTTHNLVLVLIRRFLFQSKSYWAILVQVFTSSSLSDQFYETLTISILLGGVPLTNLSTFCCCQF
jgi:hypothetical protein